MKILALLFFIPLFAFSEPHAIETTPTTSSRPTNALSTLKGYGIRFSCSPEENRKLKAEMVDLFRDHQLQGTGFVTLQESTNGEVLEYTLNSQEGDTDTTTIRGNSKFEIPDATETFVDQRGKTQTITYASQKEILLSLLQRGRVTAFKGKSCKIEALRDHLGMRQNIARWGAKAWFTFPEDGIVKKNSHFWGERNDWSVKPGKSPLDAIQDAFTGLKQYAIGCTKAVQLIVSQGILDYQRNIKKDGALVNELEKELAVDPLDAIEPRHGKDGVLVDRQRDVPWNNWVPGDWGWIKNDDEVSSEEMGYEGCNIVYLGAGYFAVYYDDDANRTIDQALLRVYRWRDLARRENISDEQLLNRIRKDPYDGGGLLRSVRDVPKRFE